MMPTPLKPAPWVPLKWTLADETAPFVSTKPTTVPNVVVAEVVVEAADVVAAEEAVIVTVDETAETSPEVRAFLEEWIARIPIEEMLIEMVRRDAQLHYERADGFIFPEPTALAVPEK